MAGLCAALAAGEVGAAARGGAAAARRQRRRPGAGPTGRRSCVAVAAASFVPTGRLSEADAADVVRELTEFSLDGALDMASLTRAFTAGAGDDGDGALGAAAEGVVGGLIDGERRRDPLDQEVMEVVADPNFKEMSYAKRRVRRLLRNNPWEDPRDSWLTMLELMDWQKRHTPGAVGGTFLNLKLAMDRAVEVEDGWTLNGRDEELDGVVRDSPALIGICQAALLLDSYGGEWPVERMQIGNESEGGLFESEVAKADHAIKTNMTFQEMLQRGINTKLVEEMRNPEGYVDAIAEREKLEAQSNEYDDLIDF